MTLEEVRAKIDVIDKQIKPLFLDRMVCSYKVAQAKAKTGGDVYVPSREKVVIEGRTSDVDPSVKSEYAAFLRMMMSVSRRYQYGILTGMQDKVISDALASAGLSGDTPHTLVDISFVCDKTDSNISLFLDMARLNEVVIESMSLECVGDKQIVKMTLAGNACKGDCKRLLTQIGKEAQEFKIVGLR